MNQQRILVVDDDKIIRMALQVQLQKAGYTVLIVGSGEEAIDLLTRERFDLLITELCLPSINGLQLMARAREIDNQISVIIVTGEGSMASAIAAVNQQANRYLLKPVSRDDMVRNVAEVLAQRQKIAERAQPYHHGYHPKRAEEHILQICPLRIDPRRHRVTYNGQAILLTSGDFSLLLYLAHRRGIVVSSQEIAREVLRYTCSEQEARDLTRGRIHHLRQKLESPSGARRLIHSVRGVGYRIVDEGECEDEYLSH
ncbi:response regulator transcription factor [Oscillochloris sp. ZM17-4]|uniref:response regulator transcription factor n=1 Tax=Oscillochloris sp. ZM17-4 TaxID=2866714 RepID=UPI001C73A1EB|nr:response regulator transcription factor [Oscillochloris sp. ZM17-4]MBX0330608.1 response regulator transcription factor [Oscillochloris sp. ZM17-4]